MFQTDFSVLTEDPSRPFSSSRHGLRVKFQELVYDVLLPRKVPESDALSVVAGLSGDERFVRGP